LERELIGERTADAMQHLKAQGRVYSRPVFTDTVIVTRMQQEHSQSVSYYGIADGLNADHVATARGGQWRANTVRQLLLRAHQGQRRGVA
jgi:DNA invertase Pin-like site-specific DNA recombinase